MLLAVIGDIQGNAPALESALRYLDGLGVQTIFNTGGSVAGHPMPNETIALLQQYRVLSAQSELDRCVAHFFRKRKTRHQMLDEETLALVERAAHLCDGHAIEYLAGLPKRATAFAEGISFSISHGGPTNTAAPLLPDDSEESFRRQREMANMHIILTGMNATPWHRWVADTLFACPGSLGAVTGPHGEGAFMLLNTDASPWAVRVEHVSYDTALLNAHRAEGGTLPS